MAAPRQAAGAGAKKNKGTRGGRPEPQPVAAQARRAGGQAKRPGQSPSQAQRARERKAAAVAVAAPAEPGIKIPPLWYQVATWALSIAGLGVSTYLTITHFSPHALVCVSNSTFNCEKVTTSPQSEVFGIPVAILGLLFFVPMILLCLPAAWRSANRWIHVARLALSVTGVGMILYLIIAEFFIIKAICLWCSSVHIITFVLFVIIVTASPIVLARGYGTDGEGE